jgi:hypothetical protein
MLRQIRDLLTWPMLCLLLFAVCAAAISAARYPIVFDHIESGYHALAARVLPRPPAPKMGEKWRLKRQPVTGQPPQCPKPQPPAKAADD